MERHKCGAMGKNRNTRLAYLGGLGLAALLHGGSSAAAGDDILGFWLVENQRAIIEIASCGEKFCGNIAWMEQPLDDTGQPKLDVNHPDTARRGQPLCGVELIAKFKNSGPGEWSGGAIYNPKDGQTYQAQMELRDDDTLKLRGYVLVPLFGKSQIWTRAPDDRGGC
jgi:uncharacterized protein (DUF2147 family)